MLKLLQAPITSLTMGGLVFLLTVFVLLNRPLKINATAQVTGEEEQVEPEEFWKNHNPEVDQLLAEVRKEKEGIAKREAELRELAARLQAERAEINTVTQRVAQLQAEFDQNVIRVKEEEAPALKKMARLYTTMSTEAALAIFKDMDDPTLIKIFKSMKDSETAPFLDAMVKQGEAGAKRVAFITEALSRTITDQKKGP